MIRQILDEGQKWGFSTVEVFGEKVEKTEFERFADYSGRHAVKLNRAAVRAFHEWGEPVGFTLSDPHSRSIRAAYSNIGSADIPDRRENYAQLLPTAVERVKMNIFDDTFPSIDRPGFDELGERIDEGLVKFPGLRLERIYLLTILKKIYIANTNGLQAKYKKTGFNLVLNLASRGNRIEINENRPFFRQIDPSRLISRGFNLLHSLTDNGNIDPATRYLILSPEASAFILKEFSDDFKLGNGERVKNARFSPVLSIVDDPRLDGQSSSVPFDDEGVQSGEKFLIEKGFFSGMISDTETAFLSHRPSSGNGFRSSGSPFPRVRFSNLYIKPSILPLKKLMGEVGKGILVSLLKLKSLGKRGPIFSAYGYRFEKEEIARPLHFYLETSFLSYFLKILRVSKETKFFHGHFNVGSPYVLLEAKPGGADLFTI